MSALTHLRAALGFAPSTSVQGREHRRPAAVLTAQQRRQFAADGYLVLPSFCDAAELARIRESLAQLFARRAGREEGKQFDMLGLDLDGGAMRQPQLLHPSEFDPELKATAHFEKVAAIARQLLGKRAQFSFDHCIVKPPRSAAGTPWHQDEAHHAQRWFRYRQISFWMPLQDTPAVNGCMRYVPGSHLGRVLPHGPLNGDTRIHAMECSTEHFDERRAVCEPAAAGTCILHDGRTLHGALPNVSDEERAAYIIAFVGPPLLSDGPAAHSRPIHALRTASMERRRRWLWQGGFLTTLWRRARAGMRSPPATWWWKSKLLLRAALRRMRAPQN